MLSFRAFLGIVGSLTLVVGGIGVSNIMNVVVEERTREIGIKMALGARPGSILLQFMLETLLITGVGGAIGLGITFGICAAFPALGFTEYVGNPDRLADGAALTAGLLGSVGLFAGYFPARDAAQPRSRRGDEALGAGHARRQRRLQPVPRLFAAPEEARGADDRLDRLGLGLAPAASGVRPGTPRSS